MEPTNLHDVHLLLIGMDVVMVYIDLSWSNIECKKKNSIFTWLSFFQT